jgi:hypothetical protein
MEGKNNTFSQGDLQTKTESTSEFSQTGFQPKSSSDLSFISTGFSQDEFQKDSSSPSISRVSAAESKPKKDLPPRPKKRIIICCDGTWQSSSHGAQTIPSNVAKISRSIASWYIDDNGLMAPQIVYYDAGVGTAMNKIESFWNGVFLNIITQY